MMTTRGPVFLPGDPGFDDECTGFQTADAHRPAVVVGATCTDDVRAAVRHAAWHDLPVAVQTTGHGRTAALDGGVLITTSRMAGVEIDPAARTARVGAGTVWGTVVEAAGAHGLAPLSGSAPGVGAVGYTLGGGLGLLSRTFGWAVDHVRSLDLVTPDGELHHVTAQSDPGRFAALRGAGYGLGVVTGMEIDLLPVDRIHGGGLYVDAEHVADLLRAYLDWTRTVPETLTSSVALIPFPDVDGPPPVLRGRYVAHVRIASTGDAAEGERLVAPLRAAAPALIDTVGEMPFTDSASICNDPPWPHAYTGTNAMLGDLDAAALPALVDVAGPGAPMMCVVQLNHLGGALARPPAAPDSVAHRDAAYLLRVISPLEGASSPCTAAAVHGELLAAVAPWTLGRSPGFVFGAG